MMTLDMEDIIHQSKQFDIQATDLEHHAQKLLQEASHFRGKAEGMRETVRILLYQAQTPDLPSSPPPDKLE